MKIKAAAVQFAARVGMKEDNRLRMQQWIRTIKQERPDCNVIVFPELAVSGYDCGYHMQELAEDALGETCRFFSEEAAHHGIYIVYGNVEKNPKGEKPYNTVWFIGPNGSLLHTYRKIHLTSLETAYFAEGESLDIVETELGRIGFLICWDMAFPEAARAYALQKADVIIVPAAWEKPYRDPYVRFSMARALDNTTPLITCNLVGTNGTLDFFGASRMYEATGEELVQAEEGEGYIYAEIDTSDTERHRQEFYTMLRERRPHLYCPDAVYSSERRSMPKVRKIVDLSQELNANTQVYPGDPVPGYTPAATIENDGFNILHVCMGSQSGTHADAPYHFSYDGKTIEQCDLSLFMGEGVLVKVSDKQAHEPITRKDIEPYLPEMGPGKIVLLHTGWSRHNGSEQYFEHPYLAPEAATAILATGVRTIGIDAINIDDTGTNEYPVHHIIVEHDGIIIENLTNLEAVDFPHPFLSLLPLKMTGADGAPMRAVAVQFEDGSEASEYKRKSRTN